MPIITKPFICLWMYFNVKNFTASCAQHIHPHWGLEIKISLLQLIFETQQGYRSRKGLHNNVISSISFSETKKTITKTDGCNYILYTSKLTHSGLMMSYGITDLSQHWFRLRLRLRSLLSNCVQVIVTGDRWWWVNTDLRSGIKPLPEPILAQFCIAMGCHWTTMS